jgi:hypothetical protein
MSEPYTVGIDVSMDSLEVEIRPGGRRLCVANDATGWAELVQQSQNAEGAQAHLGCHYTSVQHSS